MSIDPRRLRRTDRSKLIFAVAACFVVTSVATIAFTPLRSPRDVLAVSRWGAGVPSTAHAAAVATGEPWWRRVGPSGAIVEADGSLRPVVRIPRSELESRARFEAPRRGVAYDVFLGALVFVRSLGSDDLVFDFPFVIFVQDALIVVVASALPLVLAAACVRRGESRARDVALGGVAYLAALALVPNAAAYLNEGVVDSALAPAAALAAVASLAVVARALVARSRRSLAALCLASLAIGVTPLVRGEQVFGLAAVGVVLAVAAVRLGRLAAIRLALAAALVVSVPLGHGAINAVVCGEFVPLRTQGPQNLLEAIGQFPNPYGIEYSDAWFADVVAREDAVPGGARADRFALDRYLSILESDPELLVANFRGRLAWIASYLDVDVVGWLSFAIVAALAAAWRRSTRALIVLVPAVYAAGLVLGVAWTHFMPRLVAPAHFLMQSTVASALVALAGVAFERVRAYARSREPSAEISASTISGSVASMHETESGHSAR